MFARRVSSGVLLALLFFGVFVPASGSWVDSLGVSLAANALQEVGLSSEQPPMEWNGTYGGASYDYAYSVIQTISGGYAVAGCTFSYGAGYSDFWLVKTDSDGNEQWNKTYGGPNDEYAETLVPTSDGGYALAGATWTSGSSFDFWVVKVAGSIYIRADGSVDPPTAPIDRDNDFYQLTGNVTCGFNGIVIERDNMTLDGNGFTVRGSYLGNGLCLEGRANITVANVTIDSFLHGVQADSSRLLLGGNLSLTSNAAGITFWNTNDSAIFSNYFFNNSRWAIQLNDSANDTIEANDMRNNGNNYYWNSTPTYGYYHIAIESCSNNSVLNNRISNNFSEYRSFAILLNRTSYNVIRDNNLTEFYILPLRLFDSSNNMIESNLITCAPVLTIAIALTNSSSNVFSGNNITSGLVGACFLLDSSHNNILLDNRVVWSGYGDGFYCDSSDGNIIAANTVISSISNPALIRGVSIYNSTGNSITSNRFVNESYGILLENCSMTSAHGNSIMNSCYGGVRCSPASSSISIMNNTINNCTSGISLDNSLNITVSENNITANSGIGVDINYSSAISVKRNHVEENYEGIVLTFCNSANVSENNLLSNNVTAIRLSDSSGVDLYRNNVTGSLGNGILLETQSYGSSDNTLEENTVSLSGDTGLLIRFSLNNTLRGNTLSNNKYNFGVEIWAGSDFVQDIDTSNTVDGKPIYWLTNVEDTILPADAGYVALINCTEGRIENLSLAKNVQSVLLISTNKTIITGSNISDCKAAGIQLHESASNMVSQNYLNILEGTAILLYESPNNTVLRNSVENASCGIYSYGWNEDNTIIENTLVNCSEAITLSGGSLLVRQNNITSASTGINSLFGGYHDIADNIIANVSIGIRVTGSCFTMIEGNILTSSSVGVKLRDSPGSRIDDNNIMNNVQGVYLSGSQNIMINNAVKGNTYGVYLEGAYECLLRKNIIEENAYAFYLNLSSSLNRIVDNNITCNAYGFYFFENALNNIMYQNNLVNNTHQVYDRSWDDPNVTASINIWDNGYRLRGNYWDDYNGTDADANGIGDTPYVIDDYNQDSYPLMQSWTPPIWDEIQITPSGRPIVDIAAWGWGIGYPSLFAATEKSLYLSSAGTTWLREALNFSLTSTGFVFCGDPVFCGKDGLYYGLGSYQQILNVSGYTKALGLFNNTLYVGTFLDDSPTLHYCESEPWNSSNWCIDTGFSDIMNSSAPFGGTDSFTVYNGWMYVAAGNTIYSFDGTTWSIVKTLDDVYSILDMKVYNDKLYIGTRDQPWRKPYYQGGTGFSGRVIEFDGENWTAILDHDYWIFCLEANNGTLYAGTSNKILSYNGTQWSVSYESSDNACSVISFATFLGQVYAGTGSGLILTYP